MKIPKLKEGSQQKYHQKLRTSSDHIGRVQSNKMKIEIRK